MQHLSEEQLSAAIIGEAGNDVTAHLADCAACRNEHESMALTLGGFRAVAEAKAARPAGFWYTQRAAVAAQLGGRSFVRPRLAVWAGALAVLTLAAGMLAQTPQIGAPDYSAAADPDHQLLMDVERSVQRTVPRALEPATALAQEMAQALADTQAGGTP